MPQSFADDLGGVPSDAREVPWAELLRGRAATWWVRLGDDPGSVDPESVAVLPRVLAPVLPVGGRTVEEYFAPRANVYESPPLPYVV